MVVIVEELSSASSSSSSIVDNIERDFSNVETHVINIDKAPDIWMSIAEKIRIIQKRFVWSLHEDDSDKSRNGPSFPFKDKRGI